MPHLTVEYSANLESRADLDELCGALLDAVMKTGLFEEGAIRVRALRADHYAIADRLPENGFIDLNMRIGAGRSAAEKTLLGEAIFAAAGAVLAPLFLTPHFALSLEIREIDATLSWKRNAIHPRLRAR
jgi:5-carboxymethyl-2-hydroxymuconate isomerase